jgi:hypothetical protein
VDFRSTLEDGPMSSSVNKRVISMLLSDGTDVVDTTRPLTSSEVIEKSMRLVFTYLQPLLVLVLAIMAFDSVVMAIFALICKSEKI